MRLNSKDGPKSVNVFVRISPAMNEQLRKLAEQLQADGVATVMRDIVEAALAEGIDVKPRRTIATSVGTSERHPQG